MEELLKKIFPDGYVCREIGDWKGYVGFHGNDALSLYVWGNWKICLGFEVFPDFGPCGLDVRKECHEAIMNSGLVTDCIELEYKKTLRYDMKK